MKSHLDGGRSGPSVLNHGTLGVIQTVRRISPNDLPNVASSSLNSQAGSSFQRGLTRTEAVAIAGPLQGTQAVPAKVISPSTTSSQPLSTISPSGGFEGIVTSFRGLSEAGPVPPDPDIAAGFTHEVETVNLQMRIWDATGVLLRTTSLSSFFGTGTDSLTDPKVLFDVHADRYFLSILDISTRSVDVMVSTSEDPTLSWVRYDFQFTYCPDQPIIGTSLDKFLVTGNEFDNSCAGRFHGNHQIVADKSAMLAGTAVTIQDFGINLTVFSLHVVSTDINDLYAVMKVPHFADIRVFTVTGLPPSAGISSLPTTYGLATGQALPMGVQPSPFSGLDTGDDRISSGTVGVDGNIWVGYNEGCTPSGDTVTESCFHLAQVNPVNPPGCFITCPSIQDFSVGINGLSLFYPALRADFNGNLEVVYGFSSSSVFPTIAVTGQAAGSPNTLNAPLNMVSSSTGDSEFDSRTGTNRFGDYFGAALDMNNPSFVWVVGQYFPAATWSTFVAKVQTTSATPSNSLRLLTGPTLAVGSLRRVLATLVDPGSTPISTATISFTVNGVNPTSGSCVTDMGGSCTFSYTGTSAGTDVIVATALLTPNQVSNTVTATWVLSPDFNIVFNPAPLSFPVGSAKLTSITVTSLNGFSGIVNLQVTRSTSFPCAGSPNGVCNYEAFFPCTPTLCAFPPAHSWQVSVGSGGTVNQDFSATSFGYYFTFPPLQYHTVPAPAGVYTVDLNATTTTSFGTVFHLITLTVYIWDFTMSPSNPTTVNCLAGKICNTPLTVNGDHGVGDMVKFSVSSSTPTGLTCQAPAPVPVFSGPSRTTLSCSGVSGNLAVTVTGSSGTLSRSTAPITFHLALSFLAVVRGSDSVLYWSFFNGAVWTGWQSLGGSSPSSPTLCSSGAGSYELVVRGSDNGIYHRTFSAGSWAGSWDSPTGSALDSPACAVLGNTLYIAVRGGGNTVWVNSRPLPTGSWTGWVNMQGTTLSPPVLVASPNANRLDLLVTGIDNSIYHKNSTGASWATAWDSPGGSTPNSPAAASDGATLHIVVRGTDNRVYYAMLPFGGLWSTWTSLGGPVFSMPVLRADEFGTLHLMIWGINNGLYHKIKAPGSAWTAFWDSPGGSTSNTPGVAMQGSLLGILAIGTDNSLYYTTGFRGIWQDWTALGGTSPSAPAISNSP